MKKKLNQLVIAAQCQWRNFLFNEEGDTNFISVIILLGIVVLVAAVFIGFKEQIVNWARNTIGNGIAGFH